MAVDAAVCAHSDKELQEIMQAFFFLTFKEFGFKYIKKTEVPLQKAFADEVLPNWKEFGRKDT